ncbi:MAG: hypothetical protein AAF734_09045 [Bacteroidota bacterium]
MKIILPLFYIFLLALWGCKLSFFDNDNPMPREESLPDATQEGKNTLGCLVDGEVWLPQSRALTIASLTVTYHQGIFGFSAVRNRKGNDGKTVDHAMSARINNVKEVGTYVMDEPRSVRLGNTATFIDFKSLCQYESLLTQTGTLEITKLDTVNHIIAGRFDLTFQESECPMDETEEGCPVPSEERGCPMVRITQGRFDLKYNAY